MFPDQWWKPLCLHWQVDAHPLCPQRCPTPAFLGFLPTQVPREHGPQVPELLGRLWLSIVSVVCVLTEVNPSPVISSVSFISPPSLLVSAAQSAACPSDPRGPPPPQGWWGVWPLREVPTPTWGPLLSEAGTAVETEPLGAGFGFCRGSQCPRGDCPPAPRLPQAQAPAPGTQPRLQRHSCPQTPGRTLLWPWWSCCSQTALPASAPPSVCSDVSFSVRRLPYSRPRPALPSPPSSTLERPLFLFLPAMPSPSSVLDNLLIYYTCCFL